MTGPKPVELTDDEIRSLEEPLANWAVSQVWLDDTDPLCIEVAVIVAAREAAARREALLEAADWIAEAHPNVRGLLCAAMDIRGFAEVDVVDMADTIARVEALAHRARLGTVSASDITAALAEPERDEEGGR